MIRRMLIVMSCLLWMAAPALALQQAPAGQEGFVPVTELPASQQLPAAPYLIGAYAFIWVALMVYLWSIWSRLGKVEKDIHALEQRSQKSTPR